MYRYYKQPTLIRTGCLGAKKGCLTTGPSSGANPMKVTGRDFHTFVNYNQARCRFSYDGGAYYDRLADYREGDAFGAGLLNGSIEADPGLALYCLTPKAPVDSKIVTQVAVALNGVDLLAPRTCNV